MEKISALMDGELDARDSKLQIERLGSDAKLADGWNTFHLIGDCLRNESILSRGFSQRLHQRLEQEPTVLAPRPTGRKPSGVARYALPMAAAAAGIAVVAWLGFSSSMIAPSARTNITQADATERPAKSAPPPVALVSHGNMSDYLRAHQEFSPSTAMQGVASYVRTVSNEDQNSDR